jgi:hypothetical protein
MNNKPMKNRILLLAALSLMPALSSVKAQEQSKFEFGIFSDQTHVTLITGEGVTVVYVRGYQFSLGDTFVASAMDTKTFRVTLMDEQGHVGWYRAVPSKVEDQQHDF